MKILTALLLSAGLFAGCGEKPQTIGDYRGKADAKPYEANYGGDKAKWESAMRARSQNQNEYQRVQ